MINIQNKVEEEVDIYLLPPYVGGEVWEELRKALLLRELLSDQ